MIHDTIPDLCVIGGGWAGLAAAIEATGRGLQVCLIDAAPQLGGRARSLDIDMGFGPVQLDNGQHLMMGAYDQTLALMDRITPGAEHLLQRRRLSLRDTAGLSMNAAPLPAPWHLALALLGAEGLGPGGRLACIRLFVQLRLHRWKVSAGETVDQLLRRTAQPQELIDRLWRPLCVSALNTPPDRACAQTFAIVLRDTLGADAGASDFILPIQTLGDCLPAPALRWLRDRGADIRLRSPARGLAWQTDRWVIDQGGHALTARALVLAVPPTNGARLLQTCGHPVDTMDRTRLIEALLRFEPMPIATTYLAWPEAHIDTLPPWVMLSQPRAANTGMPAPVQGDWLFDRGVQNRHRIAAVVASALDAASPPPLDRLQSGLIHGATTELGLPSPTHAFTAVERRATFACVPDRPKIHQPPEGVLKALWLAGDYMEHEYPATIESAVRSGLRAARQAAESLGAQARVRAPLATNQSQAAASA